ncbi:MAG: hypothetical protein JWR80_9517 [Bradyrhizobium sp.]|nr:hypothetical protein [Bradyrhizobium sp.]
MTEERVKEMQDVYDLIIATCEHDPEFKAWGASALRYLNKVEGLTNEAMTNNRNPAILRVDEEGVE